MERANCNTDHRVRAKACTRTSWTHLILLKSILRYKNVTVHIRYFSSELELPVDPNHSILQTHQTGISIESNLSLASRYGNASTSCVAIVDVPQVLAKKSKKLHLVGALTTPRPIPVKRLNQWARTAIARTEIEFWKSWACVTFIRAKFKGTAQHLPGFDHQLSSLSLTVWNGSLHPHHVPVPDQPPRGSLRTPPCETSCRLRDNPREVHFPPFPAALPSQEAAGPAWCFGHLNHCDELSWWVSSLLRTSCNDKLGCSQLFSCHLWSRVRICSQHLDFWIGNLITESRERGCGKKERGEE